jgi:hypothetical protein
MLIQLPKALELITKGKHTLLITTDGKLALVPHDKADLKITSSEAVNLMFYVVRTSGADETAVAQAEIESAIAKVAERGTEEDQARARMEKYRQIRDSGS